MAACTECNQVFLGIIAALATEFLVVDLQILSGTTDLASPAIASQYFISELFVEFGLKAQAWSLGLNTVHETFAVVSWRKASRCSAGRHLKNRDTDCRSAIGSSFSRCAPARKSAQIISRQ